MNAGTIATLRPIADPLESWARSDGSVPCLDVHDRQASVDGTVPDTQTATAASRIEESYEYVTVNGTSIDTDTAEREKSIVTDVAIDATNHGIAVAESVTETGDPPFPFDLLTVVAGVEVEPVGIDTDALASAWESDDRLRGTWMRAQERDDEFAIGYGDAGRDLDVNAGVGFETAWNGTVVSGVAWPSGYVACHRDLSADAFVQFLADEIMPFAEPLDDAPGTQATL